MLISQEYGVPEKGCQAQKNFEEKGGQDNEDGRQQVKPPSRVVLFAGRRNEPFKNGKRR